MENKEPDKTFIKKKKKDCYEGKNIYYLKTKKSRRKVPWNSICNEIKKKFKLTNDQYCLKYTNSLGNDYIINNEETFEKAIDEMKNIKSFDNRLYVNLIFEKSSSEMKKNNTYFGKYDRQKRGNYFNLESSNVINQRRKAKLNFQNLEGIEFEIEEFEAEKEQLIIQNTKEINDIFDLNFSEISKFIYNKINSHQFNQPPTHYINPIHLKYFVDDDYNPYKRKPTINLDSEIKLLSSWFDRAKDIVPIVVKKMNCNIFCKAIIEQLGKNKIRLRIKACFHLVAKNEKIRLYKFLHKNFGFYKDGIDTKWNINEGTKRLENFIEFALRNFSHIKSIPIYLNDF